MHERLTGSIQRSIQRNASSRMVNLFEGSQLNIDTQRKNLIDLREDSVSDDAENSRAYLKKRTRAEEVADDGFRHMDSFDSLPYTNKEQIMRAMETARK